MSSATIAFAKSQTLALAEMDRLQEEGKLIQETQDTDLTSTTPRDSESPSDGCVSESEECVAQCEEKNAEPSSYGWYRTNEDSVLSNEPTGYSEYSKILRSLHFSKAERRD